MLINNKKIIAQGTIEYLVIIAIVVIIGLVVVSMMVGLLDQGSGVSEKSSKLSNWTNTIAITETSVDPDGNYLVRLANNSGEELTITGVQVGDTTGSYSEDLFNSGAQNFVIPSGESCVEGENATRQVKVTYYSKYGVQKTEVYPASTFFDCESYSVNLLASRCPPSTGTDTSDATAYDANILASETCYGSEGDKLTGNIPTRTPSDSSTLFSSGYYASDFNLSILDSDLNSASILSGVTIFGIIGTASAGGGDPGFGFIEFATPSYSDSGSGTVTDSANGLVWQASSYNNGAPLAWQDAMNYCGNNDAGLPGTGWRVPNMAEVGLLYNYTSWAMYGSPFTNNTNFWSSTTVPSTTIYAYFLYSSTGEIYYGSKTVGSAFGVRCVRSE